MQTVSSRIWTQVTISISYFVNNMVFIQPHTRQDLTQGHFIVGSHMWIETYVWQVQKMHDPVGIPLLGSSGTK